MGRLIPLPYRHAQTMLAIVPNRFIYPFFKSCRYLLAEGFKFALNFVILGIANYVAPQ